MEFLKNLKNSILGIFGFGSSDEKEIESKIEEKIKSIEDPSLESIKTIVEEESIDSSKIEEIVEEPKAKASRRIEEISVIETVKDLKSKSRSKQTKEVKPEEVVSEDKPKKRRRPTRRSYPKKPKAE